MNGIAIPPSDDSEELRAFVSWTRNRKRYQKPRTSSSAFPCSSQVPSTYVSLTPLSFLPASPIGVVIPVSRLRSNPNAHIGKREEEDQLPKSLPQKQRRKVISTHQIHSAAKLRVPTTSRLSQRTRTRLRMRKQCIKQPLNLQKKKTSQYGWTAKQVEDYVLQELL